MRFINIIIVAVLLLTVQLANSQRVHSFLINDKVSYNPAGLSSVNSLQFNLKTFDANISGMYGQKGYFRSVFPVKKLNSHIGVDAQFFNQEEFLDTKIGFSYAFKKSLSENTYISVGAQFSVYSIRDQINYTEIDETGQIVNSGSEDLKSDLFNLDAGIWFQSANVGLGITYNHLNNPVLDITSAYIPVFSSQLYYYDYEPEFNVLIDYRLNLLEFFNMYNSLFIYDVVSTFDEVNKNIDVNMNNIFTLNNTFLFGTVWEYIELNSTTINLYSLFGFTLKQKYQLMVVYNLLELKLDEGGGTYYNPKRIKPNFECSIMVNL